MNNSIIGWYGKLPTLGDFASRRLPNSFITPWDAWLQHRMTHSRQELGERWLDHYLGSPLWRFALGPAVVDESTWCGLLLPSVDRVGRYFPLTLALRPTPMPASSADIYTVLDWLESVTVTALAALDPHTPLDVFDRGLAELPWPLTDITDPLSATFPQHVGGLDALCDDLLAYGKQQNAEALRGRSVWWRKDSLSSDYVWQACVGLPDNDTYIQMLT